MTKKAYRIDINCDLGEGEPLARTRALMRLITSANVACGGHAGTARSMETCVQLIHSLNVKLGAHPGFLDRENFGRKLLPIRADDLELLLLQQVGALEKIARRHRVPLHHVKLHGALYHAVEKAPALARRYVATMRTYWPRVRVYAVAGGVVWKLAHGSGVNVWQEAFADRAYAPNGVLVPRGQPGAIFTTPEAVATQTQRFLRLKGHIDTICIHADTTNAIQLVREVVKVASESN